MTTMHKLSGLPVRIDRLRFGGMSMLRVSVLGLVFVLVGSVSAKPLQILFLGDQGHHEPAKRAPFIIKALGKDGIFFTYTESMADLNPEYLARFDGVLIYANITEIGAAQERALLDYVAGGGGLIPVHCASYCFLNSDSYVALVGAQFKSHGTGVFAPAVTKPDHVCLRGFKGYRCWDETYVHHRHNERNREVLMERVEGGHREPWTWTRTHGEGRVFYTASGHDERCWSQPGFQDLLRRGILWAVGDAKAAAHRAFWDIEWRYEDRPTVQNYEKRNPKLKYQFPLSPAQSQKTVQTPVGFEARLFAAEPDVVCPMAFSWDHRGRLWVVESIDYPNQVSPTQEGRDRIKICEDTDGDGRADEFTVFAEGLNIPTGIVCAEDGCIVSMAPHFLFLRDTDGDDVADKRERILSGWGAGDTHATPSNLKFGFDNDLWGAVGYSGFDGEVGGVRHRFGRGIYRLSRDGGYLEFLSQFSNNTWGLGFGEANDWFGSTANNTHSVHVAIPNRYFERVKGLEAAANRGNAGNEKLDGYYEMHPITFNVRQVDVFDGFTAAAGHNLYTARDWPTSYWNRVAFVCEPTGNLVHQAIMARRGSGFEDVDGWNLCASADEWFSPVHAETGPDGQVWVADFYNFIIQHNPTPNLGRGGFDAKTGRGNAHENPLRDTEHGRIYRIVWTGSGTGAATPAPADPIAMLRSDNLFWRQTGQRLLVERQAQEAVPALLGLLGDKAVDEVGVNGAAVHAVWTLRGLGTLDGTGRSEAERAVHAALRHPSYAVRRNAALALPPADVSTEALLASGVLEDADANVRLAALMALADMPTHLGAGRKLREVGTALPEDRWLPAALEVAVGRHAPGYMQAALETLPAAEEPVAPRTPEAGPNLFPNPSFEAVDGTLPKGWRVRHYQGEATHEVVAGEARGGSRSVRVRSERGADTSLCCDLPVRPDSRYRMSAWIKTENVKGALGGLMNVHQHQGRRTTTKPLGQASRDWHRVSVEFESGEARELSFNLLFGGWGLSTGTVWFDDVELVRLGGVSAPAPGDRALRIAALNLTPAQTDWLLSQVTPAQRTVFEARAAEWGADVESAGTGEDAPADVTLEIGVIRDQLKYDKESLTVPAGKRIKLVFRNTDHMAHNLVLGTIGSYERIGAASDAMLTDPNASEHQWVPRGTKDIIAASDLVYPGGKEVLLFDAPTTPGAYPYVCTFPGHWRFMKGVLTVK